MKIFLQEKYDLRVASGMHEEKQIQLWSNVNDDEGEGVQFANAVNLKGEPFSTESLFMSLILQQQQRMINKLIQNLSNMYNPARQKEEYQTTSLGVCIRKKAPYFSISTLQSFLIYWESHCYSLICFSLSFASFLE